MKKVTLLFIGSFFSHTVFPLVKDSEDELNSYEGSCVDKIFWRDVVRLTYCVFRRKF